MTESTGTRESLRHNPLNEVTVTVERVRDHDGRSRVRKELRPPSPDGSGGPWAASDDAHHWNYWRREAEAYREDDLRDGLRRAGLDLPEARVEETDTGAVLWLEDVAGAPGPAFTISDHVELASALGRWQASGPWVTAWTSTGFLRDYSTSRIAPWHLLDDDEAWRQPLVSDLWPTGLRDGWRRLVANRDLLLQTMERLPRTRSHLDLWVSNQIRRPTGPVVLLDWAFAGDGAVGEDLGNHVPDAVLDLFWPAERFTELESACFEAYEQALTDEGWEGTARDVRLGFVASAVKYTWLLPRLLEQASALEHKAYYESADSQHLYRQRGLALAHLVRWGDEALDLLGR
jgi:hypothetical protein